MLTRRGGPLGAGRSAGAAHPLALPVPDRDGLFAGWRPDDQPGLSPLGFRRPVGRSRGLAVLQAENTLALRRDRSSQASVAPVLAPDPVERRPDPFNPLR